MSVPIFNDPDLQQEFDEDGIVSVPLLSREEIADLISAYHHPSGADSALKFHSTMFSADAAYRKRMDEEIRKIVYPHFRQMLCKYRLLFANFIVKESSAETQVGIHQDWNFTAPEYTSLNIWIPLIDITVETGLFFGLKGSHRAFRNIRYTPYEANAYDELREYIFENATDFHPQAGTALVYHGALVHYSNANRSKSPRLAIGCALIPEEAPNLHYYRRNENSRTLEVYRVNEAFYQAFDFFQEPRDVLKIDELNSYPGLPTLNELSLNRI